MRMSCSFRGLPLLLLLLSGGCCVLPPGDPPKGAIVDLTLPPERDRRGAENDAVTSLQIYTLQNCPGAAVSVLADAEMMPIAQRIVVRTGAVSGVRLMPSAQLILRAAAKEGGWMFQLYDTGRQSVVWQEHFTLKF